MIDLSTSYLGLKLRNPVVVSSSPLQKEIDNLRRMEAAGAGAIVLHSLFEEQIELESLDLNRSLERGAESQPEASRYLPDLQDYNLGPEGYLKHLERAKKSVGVPVIASLNGKSKGGWTRYARMMEEAGADAIELNIYYLAVDPDVSGSAIEQAYEDLVAEVRAAVRVPLSIKIGPTFSSLANMARRLERAGANGLVLFNRFYQPDFDLEALEVVRALHLSRSEELLPRLSWAAILFGQIQADMAITGGVHTGIDVLKCMMAGARAAMTTSALLKKGIGQIAGILEEVQGWMEEHEYESIQQMQGSMARRSVADPGAFERGNYMQVLSSYTMKSGAGRA
jgi:dihydroorotate dehydrogenase (fumarate)